MRRTNQNQVICPIEWNEHLMRKWVPFKLRDANRIELRFQTHICYIRPGFGAHVFSQGGPGCSGSGIEWSWVIEGLEIAAHDGRLQAMERLFQFDLAVDQAYANGVDERVFVRFEHTPEPLAFRWYRSIRRLLLKRFDV